MIDKDASALPTGLSQAEPEEVSALRASIPSAAICANCASWGEFGLCRVQSGTRSFGDMAWAQTVTTNHNDTCASFTRGEA